MHPVPAIHNDSKYNLSLFRTPTIPRKSTRKREIGIDELVLFQATDKVVDIDSISEQNSPENFTFKRLDNSVQLLNLKVNEKIAIPSFVVPLPQWFQYGHNCNLTKFSMLENVILCKE